MWIQTINAGVRQYLDNLLILLLFSEQIFFQYYIHYFNSNNILIIITHMNKTFIFIWKLIFIAFSYNLTIKLLYK